MRIENHISIYKLGDLILNAIAKKTNKKKNAKKKDRKNDEEEAKKKPLPTVFLYKNWLLFIYLSVSKSLVGTNKKPSHFESLNYYNCVIIGSNYTHTQNGSLSIEMCALLLEGKEKK